MKNLKNNYFTKTLSALLTLAILLGTILCLAPVSAAETEYLGKHDFNDLTQIKSTSNVMTNQDMGPSSTAVLGTHEGNSGDKYMIWTKLDNTKAPMWYFFMDANQVSTDTKRSIVAEMKLNFQTLTNAQIQLRDAAGNWSNGVWITDTGEVRIKGATGTLMATIEAKQWYTLSLVCDEIAGTVTVYLDYKQIGGFALNASHTYLNRMHIKLNTSTTAPATVLYLDDCVFYTGEIPVQQAPETDTSTMEGETTTSPEANTTTAEEETTTPPAEILYEEYFCYTWEGSDNRIVADKVGDGTLRYSRWGADTYFSILKLQGNKALFFEREISNPRLDFYDLTHAPRFVISFDLRFVDNQFARSMLMLHDGNNWSPALVINSDGRLYTAYGSKTTEDQALTVLSSDEWYHFDLLFDDSNNTYTIMVNNQVLLENVAFNNANFIDVNRFIYTFESSVEESAKVYVDNFRMYAGNKLVPMEPAQEETTTASEEVTTAPDETTAIPTDQESDTTIPNEETTTDNGNDRKNSGCSSAVAGGLAMILCTMAVSCFCCKKRTNRL